MGEQQDETTAAVESIIRQLSAIDACSTGTDSGWAEADQVRFLRVFVEEGIDELARADQTLFDFFAECVTQASENMQDARIHILEESIEKVAEGDEGSVVDFLINLGMVLALELLVVSTATYAVPALVVLAAAKAQTRRARRLATVSGRHASLAWEHKLASDALKALGTRLEESRAVTQKLKPLPDTPWQFARDYRMAAQRTASLEVDYSVGLAALERSDDLVQRAADAIEKVLGAQSAPRLTSPTLDQFLDKTMQHVALHRVAEEVATSLTDKVLSTAANAGPSATEPFKTDTVVSRFLAQIREERNTAAREWAMTKLHVRVLSDADFLGSSLAQEVFLRIHAGLASQTKLDVALQDRGFLVRGVEGALWLGWLRHIDALGSKPVTGQPFADVIGDTPRQGRVWRTMFVTKINAGEKQRPMAAPQGVDPASLKGLTLGDTADGTIFPGLARIKDEYADYLFKGYARPFFVRNPKRSPAGLVFDASRYDGVASMPESFGPLDQDRRDRIAEMKLLVIVFFQLLESDPTLIGGTGDPVADDSRAALRTLLGLPPEQDIVRDYLKSLPPVSEPDQADTEVLAGAADPALASSPDPVAVEREARDALRKLGDMATDLDVLILQAPPPISFDERDMATRSADDGLLQDIERARDAVVVQWHHTQELSTDVPAVRAELYGTYETRVAAYMAWPEPAPTFVGPVGP